MWHGLPARAIISFDTGWEPVLLEPVIQPRFYILLLVSIALILRRNWAADVPATRPSKSESLQAFEKKILRHLLELDSPDPALRERATKELIAIGPHVLKPLKEMLAD